jgi:hypothetical protein
MQHRETNASSNMLQLAIHSSLAGRPYEYCPQDQSNDESSSESGDEADEKRQKPELPLVAHILRRATYVKSI